MEIHQARAGGILIVVRGSAAEIETVRAEILRSVFEISNVRTMQKKAIIEILDLDEWTTEEEVTEAVSTLTGVDKISCKVMSLSKRYGGTQIALIETTAEVARKILKGERLLVGVVSCRVREAELSLRCIRCHSFGHSSKEYTGPDRSEYCQRCGLTGHFSEQLYGLGRGNEVS